MLASVACPDVDVVDPVELDAARDEPVEQSLVDVDRARVDEILVAGVDLRPDANVAQAQKDDRNVGRGRAPNLEGSEEKKPFWAIGVRPRAISASGRQGSALKIRRAFRELDGKPGQEIIANDAELSFSRLKQEVVAGEMKIRARSMPGSEIAAV